jgi:hypothetical protein
MVRFLLCQEQEVVHLSTSPAPSVQINDNLRCKFYNIVQKSKHKTKTTNSIELNGGNKLVVECNVNFDVIDYELLLWLVHKWYIAGQKDNVQLSTWELCKLKGIRTEQNNRKNLQTMFENLLTIKLTFTEADSVSTYNFNGSYNTCSTLDDIHIDVNDDMKIFFTEAIDNSVKVYIDQSLILKSQLSKELYWYIQLNDTIKLTKHEQQSGNFEKAEYKLRGIPLKRLIKDLSLQDSPDTIKRLKSAFEELAEKTNYPRYTYKTNGKNDLFFRPVSPIEDFV